MVRNILLLLFLFCKLKSTAQLNVSWQQVLDDSTGSEEFSDLLLRDTSGFIYSIGRVIPSGQTRTDVIIAKYDAQGAEIWRTIWAGPSGKNESIKSATLDLNGDLVLCGEYFNVSNLNDILVMKYSKSGQLQWLDTIDGTSQLYDQGNGVCIDDANNYYFTGYSLSGTYKAKLLKYSPAGQQLWSTLIPSTQQGLGVYYYQKHLYLNCMTGVTGSPSHAMLVKMDTAGQAVASISISNFYSDLISEVLINQDKLYLLDLQSLGASSGSHYGVVCVDTSLQLIWNRSYASGYLSDPIGLCSFDSMLYIAHTKYQTAGLTSPEVELRGIQRFTGDSLFISPLVQTAGVDYHARAQVIDSIGTITLLTDKSITPSISLQNYYLVRMNSMGVQISSLVLPDTVGFGEVNMIQSDFNTLFVGASIYDSQGLNNSISTWRLQTTPTGIQPLQSENPWVLAPVPAKDQISFMGLPAGKFNYVIYAVTGQVVQSGLLNDNQRRVEISQEDGFYFIRLIQGDVVLTRKFVVKD
ncbi:MAG: T9SS type A sorting domain-containing protein [Bacteroidetes bacterium]|nr:T9SS type A sorting domain-containing protein [Bacteroidota bacterium]